MTIKVQQWPTALAATRGTILDAALAAGVPYPYGCRSGDCGSCKSRLLSGEVTMEGYYAPEALTAAEREAGLILACRASPLTDVAVAWLAPVTVARAYPVRRMRATIVAKELATHDITRLLLSIKGAPLAFAPGQFARLIFRGLPQRSYSMANKPGESVLEFHIRHNPNGLVSGYVADQARIGDTLKLEGPYGTAYLRDADACPLLLVAGGSGLAPMKSILLAVLASQRTYPVYLYHGMRDTRDLYDKECLTALAQPPLFHFTPVLSMPSQVTQYRTGFVHEAVAADFTTLEGFTVYLAGPPPMVDATTDVVVSLGVQYDNVHADPFYAAPEELPWRLNLLNAIRSVNKNIKRLATAVHSRR
jgi:ferredoxin-NAD(P)+ reductase (naphthalene dioxygenase ferredoxin-specific)